MEKTEFIIESLHYGDEGIKAASPVKTLFDLFEMINNKLDTDREYEAPVYMILTDGSQIDFNHYVLNACYAKGKITEEELIQILRTSKEELDSHVNQA